MNATPTHPGLAQPAGHHRAGPESRTQCTASGSSMNAQHQPDPLFASAVYHAAMRAHYLRMANTDASKRRSHLHAARRHEWCVVNLAVKAEVQAMRLFDARQGSSMNTQAKADWFDAYVLCQVPPPVVQHWQVRRVGPDLCISFAGRRWSVQSLDGVAVGDLVAVRADSNPTGAPLLSAGHAPQPGIWASPSAPAHSCPRTAPAADTPASSGNQTTCCGSGHECSRHAQHAHGTPPSPPAATPQAHTHSHSVGTTGAAPAADSIAKLVALARRLAHEHGNPGTGKSSVSVSLHFSCGGVE